MDPRRGNPWAPVYLPISSKGLRPSPPGSSEPTGLQGWGCYSLLPGSRPPCRGPKSTGPASLHGPGGAPALTGGTQSQGVGTGHLSSHPKTPERLWVAMVLQWPSALPISHHLWPDHPLFGHCPCPAPQPPAVSKNAFSKRHGYIPVLIGDAVLGAACDRPPLSPDGVSPLQGEVPSPEAGLPAALPLTSCRKSSLILINFSYTDVEKFSRLLSRVIPCQLPGGWVLDLDLDLANAGWVGTCGAASPPSERPSLPQSFIGRGVTDLQPSASSLPSQHDSPPAQRPTDLTLVTGAGFGGRDHNCSQKARSCHQP